MSNDKYGELLAHGYTQELIDSLKNRDHDTEVVYKLLNLKGQFLKASLEFLQKEIAARVEPDTFTIQDQVIWFLNGSSVTARWLLASGTEFETQLIEDLTQVLRRYLKEAGILLYGQIGFRGAGCWFSTYHEHMTMKGADQNGC